MYYIGDCQLPDFLQVPSPADAITDYEIWSQPLDVYSDRWFQLNLLLLLKKRKSIFLSF